MRILIAKDEAFNFIYRANIDSIRKMGEVRFFSPLHDSHLPSCDILYLPGGYPELYLEDISANSEMMADIKAYAENGGRIFAECGGFMYLCHDIDNIPMCGVFPFSASMRDARLHLGYRQIYLTIDGRNQCIRGHEFHYSDINDDVTLTDEPSRNKSFYNGEIHKECIQLSAKNTKTTTALYRYKNVVAGYTHWYWAETGFPFFKTSTIRQ